MLPIKMKSRHPVHWSFISFDKNVSLVVCVNNLANPKMKSLNSYVSVPEARHEVFLQLRKTTFLHKSRLFLYEQLWWNVGLWLTFNISWLVNLFWVTFQILKWFYSSLSILVFLVIWTISDHCHLISTFC